MTHTAIHMYNYHVWANKTMMDRLKQLPQDVYTQEIQSVFPSVSKVLPHIYSVDYTWYLVLTGTSMNEALSLAFGLQAQLEKQSLEDVEPAFAELSGKFKAFLSTQDNLEQKIVLDNPYAGVRETSFAEIVLQTVNHGTYHRGNITAMLRQMGHASVMTEYALFWYAS
ncbi:DinB family protein [Paenibacillus hamazuiensis]|uniref:DinB family protein n=1 Tax=Paenibacillus hamazuiensis TaxID=2936508 RepID=UPI00200EEC18|nr:DinB family protein [Paenibacillus hamazuiensis]